MLNGSLRLPERCVSLLSALQLGTALVHHQHYLQMDQGMLLLWHFQIFFPVEVKAIIVSLIAVLLRVTLNSEWYCMFGPNDKKHLNDVFITSFIVSVDWGFWSNWDPLSLFLPNTKNNLSHICCSEYRCESLGPNLKRQQAVRYMCAASKGGGEKNCYLHLCTHRALE